MCTALDQRVVAAVGLRVTDESVQLFLQGMRSRTIAMLSGSSSPLQATDQAMYAQGQQTRTVGTPLSRGLWARDYALAQGSWFIGDNSSVGAKTCLQDDRAVYMIASARRTTTDSWL